MTCSLLVTKNIIMLHFCLLCFSAPSPAVFVSTHQSACLPLSHCETITLRIPCHLMEIHSCQLPVTPLSSFHLFPPTAALLMSMLSIIVLCTAVVVLLFGLHSIIAPPISLPRCGAFHLHHLFRLFLPLLLLTPTLHNFTTLSTQPSSPVFFSVRCLRRDDGDPQAPVPADGKRRPAHSSQAAAGSCLGFIWP
ncbi:unnamed protein product [Linum tenue]|uniref:Uncharacterized protein n=1 Tax=Linum tenue TaxID=586396 RepID=A0AAV0H578_9ROSI|nr:unnamed protein product [Linum tenue]